MISCKIKLILTYSLFAGKKVWKYSLHLCQELSISLEDGLNNPHYNMQLSVHMKWFKPPSSVAVCFMGRVEVFTGNVDDFMWSFDDPVWAPVLWQQCDIVVPVHLSYVLSSKNAVTEIVQINSTVASCVQPSVRGAVHHFYTWSLVYSSLRVLLYAEKIVV